LPPYYYVAASHALAEMGDKLSVSDLRAAIAVEQDSTVRSALERDLLK
jgi:hypothetical protein